jgi:hypothetical protein
MIIPDTSIDLDVYVKPPKPAKPCLRDTCKSEGTHRIDALFDGYTTRLTFWACEHHYITAKLRWEFMLTGRSCLYAWFRGRQA